MLTGAKPVPEDELAGLFDRLGRYDTLIVAVSGGADSTALMHLLVRWVKLTSFSSPGVRAPHMVAATVDHGLRPESVGEAAFVASQAGKLGIPHHILRWQAAKPATAIQATARAARYRLLEGLALGYPAPALVTAHHRDDQAETVLMRLARGSGLDGLAGIRASRPAGFRHPIPRERPLLGLPKDRLVATLKADSIDWCEDPSNHNASFERVRWRQAQNALAALGLTSEPLARSAFRLERARLALESLTSNAWSRIVNVHDGAYARLGRDQFDAEPEEIRLRLLTRALTAFGGTGEAPSLSQVETVLANFATGVLGRQTLAGCLIERDRSEIRLLREPGRQGLPSVAMRPGAGLIWDNRFQVTLDPTQAGLPAPVCGTVRGLGADGLAALGAMPDAARLPVRIAATLPSYWSAGRLVAVPHLGQTVPGFTVRFLW